MRILKVSVIVFSTILSIQYSFPQKIDIENFNHQYLEHLIKAGIDNLRTSRGLQPLRNDSILLMASHDHAIYMQGTNILAHDQKEGPEKETPHKRITYYGGTYSMTAENIAVSYIYVPLTSRSSRGRNEIITDYQDLAGSFVKGWDNSPGHHRNIMTPDFNLTGVCVSYNPMNQAVFAVQKFGMTDALAEHTDHPDLFPESFEVASAETYGPVKSHRRHVWRIKSGEKISDSERNKYNSLKRHLNHSKLFYTWNGPSVSLCQLNLARHFFRNKRDGLALEFVPLLHYVYDSVYHGRPALRNDACIFNGYVTRPVYRDEILATARIQSQERNHSDLRILFQDVPQEVRYKARTVYLLVLNNNRIIDRIAFLPDKTGLLEFPVTTDTIPFDYQVTDTRISLRPKRDTIFRRIYFERNETRIDPSSISSVVEKLRDPGTRIIHCNIFAFASVEGTEEINNELYARRADNLMDIIKKESGDSVTANVLAMENWPMFRAQLKNTEFAFLADSSESYIRNFFSTESLIALFEKELDFQRHVGLYMIFEEIQTEQSVIDNVIADYIKTFRHHDEILERIMLEKMAGSSTVSLSNKAIYGVRPSRRPGHVIPKPVMDRMLAQQQFIFTMILEGKIPFSLLDTLPYMFVFLEHNMPHNPDRLAYEYRAFRLVYDKRLTAEEGYNFLKGIARFDLADPLIAINYFIMTLNENYHDGSFEPYAIIDFNYKLKYFLDLLDEKEHEYCLQELRAYYHTRSLTTRYRENPFRNFTIYRTSISFLYNYFSNTLLHEDFRYQAVLFFNLLRLNSAAFPILESIYLEGTENVEYVRHYIVAAINISDYTYSTKYQRLIEAMKLLPQEDWCELFYTEPYLNSSILDLELFRNLYCRNCVCI